MVFSSVCFQNLRYLKYHHKKNTLNFFWFPTSDHNVLISHHYAEIKAINIVNYAFVSSPHTFIWWLMSFLVYGAHLYLEQFPDTYSSLSGNVRLDNAVCG